MSLTNFKLLQCTSNSLHESFIRNKYSSLPINVFIDIIYIYKNKCFTASLQITNNILKTRLISEHGEDYTELKLNNIENYYIVKYIPNDKNLVRFSKKEYYNAPKFIFKNNDFFNDNNEPNNNMLIYKICDCDSKFRSFDCKKINNDMFCPLVLSFYFTFIQYALFNVKNDNINEKNLLLNQLANIINGLCYDKEENKINFIDDFLVFPIIFEISLYIIILTCFRRVSVFN